MYGHLTTAELTRARQAAGYLLEHARLLALDALVTSKLSTLRSDLTVEAEDRQRDAGLPQRAAGASITRISTRKDGS